MSPTSAPARTRSAWSLKDLVLLVVLGVVFGFLYWVFVQAWTALSILMGPAGDLSQHFLAGRWLLVAPIAIAIVQRPFAGVIAEVLASVVEVVFLGSAVGPLLFIAAAIQGVGSEIAVHGHPLPLLRLGGVRLVGPARCRTGLLLLGLPLRLVRPGRVFRPLGHHLISGMVLGGLLAKLIVDALAKTGVVDNFAIGARVWARPMPAEPACCSTTSPSTFRAGTQRCSAASRCV